MTTTFVLFIIFFSRRDAYNVIIDTMSQNSPDAKTPIPDILAACADAGFAPTQVMECIGSYEAINVFIVYNDGIKFNIIQ